jgi:transcriptional regulator of acetoin/glycerol metabolism
VNHEDVFRYIVVQTLASELKECPRQVLEAKADALMPAFRAMFGGEKYRMPKTEAGQPGRPSIAPEVARRAYQQGLSNTATADVTREHGISRATLYRLMKKGPPP